jgi:tRNA ligase
MATQDRAPIVHQTSKEVNRLVNALQAASSGKQGKSSKGQGFKCRKQQYLVRGTDNTFVDSWKFMDWDYKRDDLPTYARGLFTLRNNKTDYEIAARGYDKFFNIEEVNDTKWRNIENRTRGPYELSVKENGCIIFISGLEDDVLLVCSKHSTGGRGDPERAHSMWGEKWIDRHLATVGRTREDLARELRSLNVTAVAELCDDKFEEHVLAYDERDAGLYIHGVNANVPEFATWSGSMVHEFADTWGFKKAQFLVKDSLADVKAFLEGCAETGSYKGRDTEGFVIRCQRSADGASGPWEDWFFKYKFEEPYLMYRQWREATKAVIGNKPPRYKKHKKVTDEYLIFARRMFAQNPGLAKAYNQNHGIIKLREDFLKERGLKGSEIIRMEAQEEEAPAKAIKDFILVPIATIGCGKTTVAVALTRLFGWAHVQNDNITGKANRPKQFAQLITGKLLEHPVCIADRNNHQKRERTQLFDDITPVIPSAKFIALHYVHDPKDEMLPEIRRATRRRVLDRGDNHQTIRAETKGEKEILGIMEGFLLRFEPLDRNANPDDGFDEVIDLDVSADSQENLEVVVRALHESFPKLVPEVPSATQLQDAIEYALNEYSPNLKHDLSFNPKGKKGRSRDSTAEAPKKKDKDVRIEYFCIRLPHQRIIDALEETFAQVDEPTARVWLHLQQMARVQGAFHITLIHAAAKSSDPALWNTMNNLYAAARTEGLMAPAPDPSLDVVDVTFERVVWDERVMTLVAHIADRTWEARCVNEVPHATIGTVAPSVKPKESNDLLHRWAAAKQNGTLAAAGIYEAMLSTPLAVVGDVRAVTPLTRGG